jgi:hypothetical protein
MSSSSGRSARPEEKNQPLTWREAHNKPSLSCDYADLLMLAVKSATYLQHMVGITAKSV